MKLQNIYLINFKNGSNEINHIKKLVDTSNEKEVNEDKNIYRIKKIIK